MPQDAPAIPAYGDEDAPRFRKLVFWKRVSRIAPWFIIVPLIIGVSGTILGMIREFQDVDVAGGGDPADLSAGVANSFRMTSVGIAIAFPSFFVLIFAYLRIRQLAR